MNQSKAVKWRFEMGEKRNRSKEDRGIPLLFSIISDKRAKSKEIDTCNHSGAVRVPEPHIISKQKHPLNFPPEYVIYYSTCPTCVPKDKREIRPNAKSTLSLVCLSTIGTHLPLSF